MNPRYVTGVGFTCALGTGTRELFAALATAQSLASAPPASIESFDATKYDDARIVEVPGFDATKYLGDKGLRTLDRLTKLLVVAARLCLHDAGLKKDNAWAALSPERVGVCCSNAYGSLEAIAELDRVAQLEDARYINPAKFPNTVSNSASGYVSIWEDLRALNVSVSDGNCGGLDAVACTDVYLDTARADVILTGGGEAMSEPIFLAFRQLGMLGPASGAIPPPPEEPESGERLVPAPVPRATRSGPGGTPGAPRDVGALAGSGSSAGPVGVGDTRLGEGAAFLALETPATAKARGASVLGVITGYGTSFVANDTQALVVASREAMTRAIRDALTDANLAAKDVDLVVSSASGLARFDDEELAAIDGTVGDKPVVAPKIALGETLGAGGALAMVAALAWLGGTTIAPDFFVRGEAPSAVRHVLVTAIGYYGNASAVVMIAPPG